MSIKKWKFFEFLAFSIILFCAIFHRTESRNVTYNSIQEAVVAGLLGNVSQMSQGCLENDCTLSFAKENCAIIIEDGKDISPHVSDVLKSLKKCLTNKICGFQFEPFSFPKFSQSFKALGFKGTCLTKNDIVVTGISQFVYDVQSPFQENVQSNSNVKLNISFPNIRPTGVELDCTLRTLPATTIFSALFNFATTIFGLSQTSMSVQLAVDNIKYNIQGQYFVSFGRDNATASQMKLISNPIANVDLRFSSSVAKQMQSLGKWITTLVLTSSLFTRFFYDMLSMELLEVFDSFLYLCFTGNNNNVTLPSIQNDTIV